MSKRQKNNLVELLDLINTGRDRIKFGGTLQIGKAGELPCDTELRGDLDIRIEPKDEKFLYTVYLGDVREDNAQTGIRRFAVGPKPATYEERNAPASKPDAQKIGIVRLMLDSSDQEVRFSDAKYCFRA